MLSVAKVLRSRGVDVCFSSSKEVADFIEWNGFRCNRLPHADVVYNEMGEVSVKDTLMTSPLILARTFHQMQQELSNLVHFEPDAVLADSVLSTVLGGRILGKHVITVLNQLTIESSSRDFRARFRVLSAGTSAGMGKLWGRSHRILLPDLPPPYTISEKNLWNSSVDNTRYIGFLTPEDNSETDETWAVYQESNLPKVFWQVSGPRGTRAPLVKKAMEIAKANSSRYTFVITGGVPNGATKPTKIPGGWYYGWCKPIQHYFGASDLIVARAGHSTVAAALMNGKPSLLIPIHKQTEQEGNAKKAVKLGVSLAVDQESLSPSGFRGAADSLLGEKYLARAKELSSYANSFDAKSEIVRALEDSS